MLRDTLGKVLKQYKMEDQVLFQMMPQSVLCLELTPDYPYLDDGSLDIDYVNKCMQKAVEVYDFMGFGKNILVVYDDTYGNDILENKIFLENCLVDVEVYEDYRLTWQFPIDENDLSIHQDSTVYTCKRHLYLVKDIDTQKLFQEIIKSDIGGSMDFASSVFIIDLDSFCIFKLYDDRGLDLFAPNAGMLAAAREQFYDDLLYKSKKIEITVHKLYWQDEMPDEPNDLCLHGDITVTIGDEELSYACTVSAAALRMLKTLTENHKVEHCGEQMLPCCGFFIIPNETLSEVDISGCDYGVDWTVLHEDGRIKLITENGNETWIDFEKYKSEVLCFADEVEAYYKSSTSKHIPEDEFDRNGYIAFWNEWHRRRN